MNAKDQEDLETWLEEVELARKEIEAMTSGSKNVEEVDKSIQMREAKKKRQQEEQDRIRREAIEKKKQGRFGKGHKENYIDFCKFCFREYEFPTPQCVHCGKNTESMQERRNYLLGKVQQYQTDKTRKKERKVKWDLWKKTQAMLWKKNSTNYSKWDYFTSSSESQEEETDPIVPENDPQFKAMEQDMEKRAKDRKEKRKKAEECKKKGNDYMQQGNYEKAVLWYSEGLDLIKDYKPLWTNRALAWIKLGYFKKAIKDCSRILEYCECFEDGYEKSKDFTFKAFLRRALARKERKDFREALEDVDQCLILIPKDKDAVHLKEEIEAAIEHQKKANQLMKDKIRLEKKEQDQKLSKQEKQQENKPEKKDEKDQENSKKKQEQQEKQKEEEDNSEETQKQEQESQKQNDDIKEEVSEKNQKQENVELKEEKDTMEYQFNEAESIQKSYMQLIDTFIKKENKEISEVELHIIKFLFTDLAESKIYFFEKKGLQKLLEIIQLQQQQQIQQIYMIIDIFVRDNILYQHKLIELQGIKILCDKILLLLETAQKQKENYDSVEQILEIFVSLSMSDKSRYTLQDSPIIIEFFEKSQIKVFQCFKSEVPMVSNWLKFLGNMCYQQSKVKQILNKNLDVFLNLMYPIFKIDKQRSKYELLRESAYTVLSNLLTESQARERFSQGEFNDIFEQILLRISSYDLQKYPKYVNVASASLTVLVNASFKAQENTKKQLNNLRVGEIIYNRFSILDYKQPQYQDLFFRLLQTLSSLDYREHPLIQKSNIHQYIIKFFDNYSITCGYTNHAIRILASIFGQKENEIWLSQNVNDKYFDLLTFQIKKIIENDDDELRFSNCCTLGGMLSLHKPELINPMFSEIVQKLVYVCSNKTGNMRKTAAHFLGKLCKDPQNLQKCRDCHGIEILHSILKQVV